MQKTPLQLALILCATLYAGAVFADDPAEDEDTMTVVEEGDTPEDIVSTIQLPDAASDTAREHAAKGLETANAARADGRAFGQAMAEEHRNDAGSDARESAAEIAASARENAAGASSEARTNAADASQAHRR